MGAHFAFCGGNVFQPVQDRENRSWRLARAHRALSDAFSGGSGSPLFRRPGEMFPEDLFGLLLEPGPLCLRHLSDKLDQLGAFVHAAYSFLSFFGLGPATAGPGLLRVRRPQNRVS